jgi:FecR protein
VASLHVKRTAVTLTGRTIRSEAHTSTSNIRRLKAAVVAIFALSVGLLLADPGCAQMVAGTITGLSGNSTIMRASRSFPAAYSAPVDVADQVETSNSGRLTVTLIDGSQLEVTESSTLLISENLLNPNGTRGRTMLTLFGGLVRSWVKTVAGSSPNYEVHTPNAVASARGTIYDTYYTNNETRPGFNGCREFTDVYDYDGIVRVISLANPTSPPVELHSGEKTTVPCGLGILPPSSIVGSAGVPGAGAGGSGTGLGGAAIASMAAGAIALIGGGVAGGYAAAGGFDPSGTAAAGPSISPAGGPEIDPGEAKGAFALLGCVLLLLIERLRRR